MSATLVPHVELAGLDRPDWLAARRQGLGSSDVAAIFGLDRFKSATAVYYDKVEGFDEDESQAMKMGRLLEPVVAQCFEDETGFALTEPPAMYRHPDHAWALASPDRFLASEYAPSATILGILEAKTSRLEDDWDAVPARVEVQVQWQLAITGLALAYVCVLLHGREVRHWRVERDDEAIGVLLDQGEQFWQRVVDRRPPPLDGHQATTDALRSVFASAVPLSSVEIGEHGAALLAERQVAKAVLADAEKEVDRLDNTVKALLGTNAAGTIDGEVAVTWNEIGVDRFDSKAHEAGEPECHAAYQKHSTYRRLDVKRKRKAAA